MKKKINWRKYTLRLKKKFLKYSDLELQEIRNQSIDKMARQVAEELLNERKHR